MNANHPDVRKNARGIRERHILIALAAVLAFAVVYFYANEPKLYYAVAAATFMAIAIYLAHHLQLHRKRGWGK
jgi:heme O synthase-like polyprenyltransferase